jgi:dTDP-glucose 4,6-dehydratase
MVCMDNLITGSTANIQHLKDNESFEFVQHNVAEYIRVDGKIDYVLHFASPASPVDFLRLPIQTLKAGALGTLNALGVARANGARFLLASSSEVYGDPLINPQGEGYWGNVNPVGPRAVYDESKRFAEALTMAYHRQHGIDTRIARIFNTYGPRMRKNDGRVIPTFITQALNNEPLSVFGDGSQTRSFCYISDLIEGIYRLMLSDLNEPTNLGNPEEISILELGRKILEITRSRSEIVHKPLPEDDPRVRRPDIARAREILGWNPKVDLREGLTKTLRWF